MAWGHAVSDDLVGWQELSPALLADDAHAIFSGSAVIDDENRAGFGAGAMVAIYTGAAHAGDRQVQCLAVSLDRGRTWEKFADNPVLDLNLANFRDPNVFWHAPTEHWIMTVALSTENRAMIFASDDLRVWRELSTIDASGLPGDVWECPLLIELPVEGGDRTRWLFKVDVLSGGPGSGALAVTGTFDGANFVADRAPDGGCAWFAIDHGRDFYAAIAWHAPRDAQGRPRWIGWMGNHAYQRATPPRGWRGIMSMPRLLSLRDRSGRWELIQAVEDGLAQAFAPIADVLDSRIEMTIPLASRLSLSRKSAGVVRISLIDAMAKELTIVFDSGGLTVERGAAIDPHYDEAVSAEGFDEDAILWIDATSLEISAIDGSRWFSVQHCLDDGPVRIRLTADEAVSLTAASFTGSGEDAYGGYAASARMA